MGVQVAAADARWCGVLGHVAGKPHAGRWIGRSGMKQMTDDGGTTSFGFLTAIDSPMHGLFGGYLVVDALGRPLEFHCTAPVKVTRAQQILYGPTLHGHLHGQQIGGALLAESQAKPAVVLIDSDAMLHVRPHTKLPVAIVRPVDAEPVAAGFTVGAAHVSPHPTDAAHGESLRERLAELAAAVDLREPFERIRAAIEEAQRH